MFGQLIFSTECSWKRWAWLMVEILFGEDYKRIHLVWPWDWLRGDWDASRTKSQFLKLSNRLVQPFKFISSLSESWSVHFYCIHHLATEQVTDIKLVWNKFMASKLLRSIKATDKLKKWNVQENNPKLCKSSERNWHFVYILHT